MRESEDAIAFIGFIVVSHLNETRGDAVWKGRWVVLGLGNWVVGWLGGWVAGLLGGWVAGWLGGWVAGLLDSQEAGWFGWKSTQRNDER